MLRGTLHASNGANTLGVTGYLDLLSKILLLLHSQDLKLGGKRLYLYFHSLHSSSFNLFYVHVGFERS